MFYTTKCGGDYSSLTKCYNCTTKSFWKTSS